MLSPVRNLVSSSFLTYLIQIQRGFILTRKLVKQKFPSVKLQSYLQMFYRHNYAQVGWPLCQISFPKVTTDMFQMLPPHPNLLKCVHAWATQRVPNAEQDYVILRENLRSPKVFARSSLLCCLLCTVVCLLSFFLFCHGVVCLFSTYRLNIPFVIYCLCFISLVD